MDSIDTNHVPPPDPAFFWELTEGQTCVIAIDPFLSLKVLRVRFNRVQACMVYQYRPLVDWLNLNRPCVALRLTNDEPAVTLTLREVKDKTAYVQVTAHPSLNVVVRQ